MAADRRRRANAASHPDAANLAGRRPAARRRTATAPCQRATGAAPIPARRRRPSAGAATRAGNRRGIVGRPALPAPPCVLLLCACCDRPAGAHRRATALLPLPGHSRAVAVRHTLRSCVR